MFEEGIGLVENGNVIAADMALGLAPTGRASDGWPDSIRLNAPEPATHAAASDFCRRFCRSGGCHTTAGENQLQ